MLMRCGQTGVSRSGEGISIFRALHPTHTAGGEHIIITHGSRPGPKRYKYSRYTQRRNREVPESGSAELLQEFSTACRNGSREAWQIHIQVPVWNSIGVEEARSVGIGR